MNQSLREKFEYALQMNGIDPWHDANGPELLRQLLDIARSHGATDKAAVKPLTKG